MAKRVLARAFKKSSATDGVILMADEVGFMMNPSIKKTWAPLAKTPTVPYRDSTELAEVKRHHQKVSVLGAVVLHSTSGKIDLLCDFHPVRLSSPKSDSYVRAEQAAAFLHRVLAEYPTGPIDLVWDNLQGHKAPIIKEVVADHPRLTLHYLPPYARTSMRWNLSGRSQSIIAWPTTASMIYKPCIKKPSGISKTSAATKICYAPALPPPISRLCHRALSNRDSEACTHAGEERELRMNYHFYRYDEALFCGSTLRVAANPGEPKQHAIATRDYKA